MLQWHRMRPAAFLFCVMLGLLTACVERTMIVRSDPDRATVLVDGNRAGVTPCEIPFTFYGTREIILERDRHKSVKTMVTLTPPFYQFFPLDLITDVMLPFKIHDVHSFSFVMEPSTLGPDQDDTLKRAKELKDKLDRPDQ